MSRFYGIFIPTAAGSTAVRWYKVTQNKTGRAFFLATIFFERTTFCLVAILFAVVPLYFIASSEKVLILKARVPPIMILMFILLSITLAYLTVPKITTFINHSIRKIFLTRIKSQKIESFFDNFVLKNYNTSVYVTVFGLSFLWHLVFIVRLFVLFKTAFIPLTIMDAAWMGSLVLMLQVLPLSFAGIGIREGAYAFIFNLFGLVPEKGVLVGLLLFSQMLLFAAIGGFFEITQKK